MIIGKNRMLGVIVAGSAIMRMLLAGLNIVVILLLANSLNVPERFLQSSSSPSGKYTLEAYRAEPGATVDFSIKVYLLEPDGKKLIYDAYHEREVEIYWLNESTVSINGRSIDLELGESYDWRRKRGRRTGLHGLCDSPCSGVGIG